MLLILFACGSDKADDTAPTSMATLTDEATELLQGPIVTCADQSARLQNSMQERHQSS
jgi:hypothetical protein